MLSNNPQSMFYSSFVPSINTRTIKIHPLVKTTFQTVDSIRQWLDNIEINDRQLARLVSQLIPDSCPFARDVKFLGRTLAHIPPLCHFNPFYEQLVGLRFRALCYLVDICGETV
jgi:hypothetical protein